MSDGVGLGYMYRPARLREEREGRHLQGRQRRGGWPRRTWEVPHRLIRPPARSGSLSTARERFFSPFIPSVPASWILSENLRRRPRAGASREEETGCSMGTRTGTRTGTGTRPPRNGRRTATHGATGLGRYGEGAKPAAHTICSGAGLPGARPQLGVPPIRESLAASLMEARTLDRRRVPPHRGGLRGPRPGGGPGWRTPVQALFTQEKAARLRLLAHAAGCANTSEGPNPASREGGTARPAAHRRHPRDPHRPAARLLPPCHSPPRAPRRGWPECPPNHLPAARPVCPDLAGPPPARRPLGPPRPLHRGGPDGPDTARSWSVGLIGLSGTPDRGSEGACRRRTAQVHPHSALPDSVLTEARDRVHAPPPSNSGLCSNGRRAVLTVSLSPGPGSGKTGLPVFSTLAIRPPSRSWRAHRGRYPPIRPCPTPCSSPELGPLDGRIRPHPRRTCAPASSPAAARPASGTVFVAEANAAEGRARSPICRGHRAPPCASLRPASWPWPTAIRFRPIPSAQPTAGRASALGRATGPADSGLRTGPVRGSSAKYEARPRPGAEARPAGTNLFPLRHAGLRQRPCWPSACPASCRRSGTPRAALEVSAIHSLTGTLSSRKTR